jgi:hypothetical protein
MRAVPRWCQGAHSTLQIRPHRSMNATEGERMFHWCLHAVLVSTGAATPPSIHRHLAQTLLQSHMP